MIVVDLSHVKTLDEFYKHIRSSQEKRHGDDYCEQHDAVRKYASECKTYAELGVHQGATLANALLSGFKYVEGIDNDMRKYEKFLKPIAEQYAKDNEISLKLKQCDSASVDAIGPKVDMLLIDSLHHYFHMSKELKLHGPRVNKYIIAHDTMKPDEQLHHCLIDFCSENPEWRCIERGITGYGYTVLSKYFK